MIRIKPIVRGGKENDFLGADVSRVEFVIRREFLCHQPGLRGGGFFFRLEISTIGACLHPAVDKSIFHVFFSKYGSLISSPYRVGHYLRILCGLQNIPENCTYVVGQ